MKQAIDTYDWQLQVEQGVVVARIDCPCGRTVDVPVTGTRRTGVCSTCQREFTVKGAVQVQRIEEFG